MIDIKPDVGDKVTPDRGIGYLHKWYDEIGQHEAESIWQTCMCRSCQDLREIRKLPRGTSFRRSDERY